MRANIMFRIDILRAPASGTRRL